MGGAVYQILVRYFMVQEHYQLENSQSDMVKTIQSYNSCLSVNPESSKGQKIYQIQVNGTAGGGATFTISFPQK